MADRVTCCPHCSTSFRITDAQLQTAKGAVRCGSCLQIFRAPDHLLPLPEAPTAAAAPEYDTEPEYETDPEPEAVPEDETGPEYETDPEPEADPEYEATPAAEPAADPEHETAPEPETWSETEMAAAAAPDSDREPSLNDELTPEIDDEPETATFSSSLFDDVRFSDEDEEDDFELELDEDALISDDMGMDLSSRKSSLGELSDDFLDLNTGKAAKSSLFDRELKVKEVENDHSDESWAEELLQEIETENAAQASARPPSDILKGFGDFTTAPSTNPVVPGEQPSSPEAPLDDSSGYHHLSTGSFDKLDEIPADEDSIDAVLGERFSARKEPLFSLTGDRDLDDAPQDGYGEEPAAAPAEPSATEPSAAEHGDLTSTRQPSPPPPVREHDLLLQGIAPAPVEMDWHVEASPWPKRLLWGGLSLLACLLLVVQFAWFKFDQYSRIEPWRGVYGTLCPVLGCTLPSLADPARVKAYNLVVRSSPQADNALIIDSILLNTAGFAQPFPDFALSFTNLQGQQLAYRRFTPQEYLGGEMAGATLMPSGQPVHISLEIVDPGADAVNYTATIPRD